MSKKQQSARANVCVLSTRRRQKMSGRAFGNNTNNTLLNPGVQFGMHKHSEIKFCSGLTSQLFNKFKTVQNNPFTNRSVTKPFFSKHYLKSESLKIKSVENQGCVRSRIRLATVQLST